MVEPVLKVLQGLRTVQTLPGERLGYGNGRAVERVVGPRQAGMFPFDVVSIFVFSGVHL